MKTLLTIASIILLSYQIDRFSKKDDVAVHQSTELITIPATVPVENTLPPAGNNDKAVKIEPVVAITTAEEAAPKIVEEKSMVYTTVVVNKVDENKSAIRQSLKAGRNFASFHNRLKETGNYLLFSTVQYKTNGFETLNAEDFTTIMQYADKLVFDSSLRVSVAGYTDNTGGNTYNEQLSLMRAVNVQRYLVDLGVREEQIILSAHGKADPAADNATAQGKKMNRRVELALINYN